MSKSSNLLYLQRFPWRLGPFNLNQSINNYTITIDSAFLPTYNWVSHGLNSKVHIHLMGKEKKKICQKIAIFASKSDFDFHFDCWYYYFWILKQSLPSNFSFHFFFFFHYAYYSGTQLFFVKDFSWPILSFPLTLWKPLTIFWFIHLKILSTLSYKSF